MRGLRRGQCCYLIERGGFRTQGPGRDQEQPLQAGGIDVQPCMAKGEARGGCSRPVGGSGPERELGTVQRQLEGPERQLVECELAAGEQRELVECELEQGAERELVERQLEPRPERQLELASFLRL